MFLPVIFELSFRHKVTIKFMACLKPYFKGLTLLLQGPFITSRINICLNLFLLTSFFIGMTPSDKVTESLLQPHHMLDMSDTPIPPKRMRRETVKKLYR